MAAFAPLLAGAALGPVQPSSATEPPRPCASGDLRYPFTPGGPNTFGVFRLEIAGGSCATARRVAKRWMARFEANIDDGRSELPRVVRGFTFTSLPVRASQTYRQRGRKGATTMWFDYRIPNG